MAVGELQKKELYPTICQGSSNPVNSASGRPLLLFFLVAIHGPLW